MDEYILIQWYDKDGNTEGGLMHMGFRSRESLREYLELLSRWEKQHGILYSVFYRSDTYTPDKVNNGE